MTRLPDRPWVPAVAALALALAFTVALLVRAGGDPSLLVHAGPPWTDATGARGSLTVQDADEAFDGQFFYRIGTGPWSTERTRDGVTFDLPALRNARWGYGALAYVASFGDPDLVPWALIGLNLAAAAAVGAVGGGLARSARRHAAWGVAFALWPGFAYSLSLDTSELVASAFALGGLLALAHRRWWASAALLSAAVLTRDTTLVVAVGVLGAGLWGLRPDSDFRVGARGMVRAGSVPVATFVLWQFLQRSRFGALPLTSSGDNNLAAPLSGLWHQLATVLPPEAGDEAFRLLNVLALAALLVAAAIATLRDPDRRLGAEQAAWLAAVAVVVLLNSYLWSGATAFVRAATEAGLLSILLILRSGRTRLITATTAGLGGMWLLTAGAQLAKLG